MTPETLVHILQDVKVDDVHQITKEYMNKLETFKASITSARLLHRTGNDH